MSIKKGDRKSMKGDGRLFRWTLLASLLVVVVIGGYESLMQEYMPEHSILTYLHGYGMLTGVQVLYKPSRSIWRPIGWTGAFMMVLLMVYSIRKRVRFLSSLGPLKYWLRGHIFLGLMGPFLITLHTTFKFNGLVAASFWAMIVTMCFGILGRYIYVQIPRSTSGAELQASEIDKLVEALDGNIAHHLPGSKMSSLMDTISFSAEDADGMPPLKALFFYLRSDLNNIIKLRRLKNSLKRDYELPWKVRREITGLLKTKSALARRRNFHSTSRKLLNYWHVVHIPLAILMFTVMFIHILAYYLFRPLV